MNHKRATGPDTNTKFSGAAETKYFSDEALIRCNFSRLPPQERRNVKASSILYKHEPNKCLFSSSIYIDICETKV